MANDRPKKTINIGVDPLIDNGFLPTHRGWLYAEEYSQTIPVDPETGEFLAQLDDLQGKDFSQIMFIADSGDSGVGQKVYYLDIAGGALGNQELIPKIVDDGNASNGRSLRIKVDPNAGDQPLLMVFRTAYPYNPDRLKKIVARVRQAPLSNPLGSMLIGVQGYSARAYHSPPTGVTTFDVDQLYACTIDVNSVIPASTEFTTHTGFIKGYINSIDGGQHLQRASDPDSPMPLLAGTTDVALAIQVTAGEFYIDSIELQEVENSFIDLPGGKNVAYTLDHIVSDGFLTPVEKRWLQPQYNTAVKEYPGLKALAETFVASHTQYTAAYNALVAEIMYNRDYLAEGSYFASMDSTDVFKSGTQSGSTTYPQALRLLFENYWEEKEKLENAISAVSSIPGMSAVLSNYSHTVPTDENGDNGNYTGCSTTLYVYEGTQDTTSTWTIAVDQKTEGITGELVGNMYTVTAMSVDTGTIRLVASKAGYSSLYATFAVTKSKQGSSSTVYELHTNTPVIKKLSSAIYVPNDLELSATKTTGNSPATQYAGRYRVYVNYGENFVLDYESESDELSPVTVYEIPENIVSMRCELYAAGGFTQLLDTEMVIVVVDGAKGEDGSSYRLQVSANVIRKSVDSQFLPSTILLAGKRHAGSGPEPYAGRFVVESSVDGVLWETEYYSRKNESTKIFVVNGDYSVLRCKLYSAGALETVLDESLVHVVTDGKPGEKGETGKITVVQYSLGTMDTPYPEDASIVVAADDVAVGTEGNVLGVNVGGWSYSAPTPGLNEFVWRREGVYEYPKAWPEEWEIVRMSGDPARGITITPSQPIISLTDRGDLNTYEILLTLTVNNLPIESVVWDATDEGSLIPIEIDDGVYDPSLMMLDCTMVQGDSTTITATIVHRDFTYVGSVGIPKVAEGTPAPVYAGVLDTAPEDIGGEPLVAGDFFLYMPVDEFGEYDDTDPLFGHVLKWDGDSWESTTDSHSVGMAAKDAFQIARESGKVIFAAVIYTEAMVAANIQAGSGTGLAGSGFRFRAMDDDYSQEGDPKVPVFDVWYHDKVLFKVDIETGNIYFGTNFLYDPISEEIRSNSGAFKIDSDGKLSFADGTADGLTVNNINVESGQFKGQLDTVTIKTFLGSGTYTTPNNYSGNTMATDMFSGIYCAAGAVPIDSLITADGTLNGKTISKVKFYTPYYTYDRWRDGNWLIGYVFFSATFKNFRVDITCTDGTTYTYRVARGKVNVGSTPTQSTYPSYPTFSSSICGSLTEGSLHSYSNPYSITALRIKDPTLEELYIYNLPMTTPSESGRIWKDGSGYLRIV